MNLKFGRTFKILLAFELILLVLIIALFFADNKNIPTAYAVKENINAENISFKVLTKAVCENKSEHVFCHDELFIRCDGEEYIIYNNNSNDFVECNNVRIRILDILNDSTKLKRGGVKCE